MFDVRSGLIDIVGDFMETCRLTRALLSRHREGRLRFDELQALVGDDEGSILFRLKERCHALFRPAPESHRVPSHREALFDLAVGSLFHEATKFRENFYQLTVYGPRVRALRSQAGDDAAALFEEFERILSAVAERLDEGLQEVEALLEQTANQLRVLLAANATDGHVARSLIENDRLASEVFGCAFDELLTEIHGSPAAGFELAGRSLLAGGGYRRAGAAFAEALARGGASREIGPLAAYARGMAAYLSRDYETSLAELDTWVGSAEGNALAQIAREALSHVEKLGAGDDPDGVGARATRLLAQLKEL